jgi:hypothetical protein
MGQVMQYQMLKQTYLYRLFIHSKIGFVIVLLILSFYIVTFHKGMDMIFFPYNGMFAIDFETTNKAFTYAINLNGKMVHITDKLYWKKDFLESSLNNYAGYIKNEQTLYLENYLKQKNAGKGALRNLLPQKELASHWPLWFISFAGYSYSMPVKVEIVQYNYVFKDGKAVLTDSASVYSNYFK